jgi:glucose/arabinose dehydrogenase
MGLCCVANAAAQTLPPNFREEIIFSGLEGPSAVEFSADGRVFVAELSGLIKVFSNLSATVPTVFADLRTNVHNYGDRGLLGMALHPDFPATPYVYVLYTHDAAIGGTAPRWGTVGETFDDCPTPPGPNTDGCVVSGRLSRIEAAGDVMTGPEVVLLEGWCQQFPSHSVGSLRFGPDGALYVSSGDGASFNYVDYGQTQNPCADPPNASQTPPTAEGGALRSQSLERPANEPAVLNGAILRVDPNTGNALPDNPLAASSDPNRRRAIAFGLRNPFRFTLRPNTSELWIGDVGWNKWEEINVIADPTSSVQNFGWPCFEGEGRQPGYDSVDLDICESLYGRPNSISLPAFVYSRGNEIIPGEDCPAGGSAISGLAFYNGGSYPPEYNGALFFADYARGCIWTIFNPA